MGKHIWFMLMSFLIALIIGLLIFNGSKTAMGIIILIFLILILGNLLYKIGIEKIDRYIFYLIVFSIPFPCLLQFLGRDALTVTTIMIYLLFAITILRHLFEKKNLILGYKELKFSFILPVLIFGSFTMSLILNRYFIGQSIRYYVANISGILLYFIVLDTIKKDSDLIMVIKIILFVLVLEACIVYLEYKFAVTTKFLEFFYPTVKVSMTEAYTIGGFHRQVGLHRCGGTVWDYELLADWFMVGSILSMGLFYNLKKNIYIFYLFCCLAGIILTLTRSVFILLIFGLMMVIVLINTIKKDSKKITAKIVLMFFLSCIILFGFLSKGHIKTFIERFETYFQQSDLLSSEAIDRKQVWDKAFHAFLREPTIFGKGLYNVEMLDYTAGSFHSLHLTLLYKIGILGLAIHFVFWLKMLNTSWHILIAKNNYGNWYTLFFLFISVVLIIIDGVKIEYLRYAHAIQFAWLIYGLLIVAIKQNKENNENIMVS